MGNSRRAVALLEVVVAASLLAVLLTICLRMLAVTALERQTAERRAIALQEAANVVERVVELPWEQVTPERLAQFEPPASLRDILPGAALRVSMAPDTDGPSGKRVQIEINWTNSAGGVDAPVRLICWSYPRTGAAP